MYNAEILISATLRLEKMQEIKWAVACPSR